MLKRLFFIIAIFLLAHPVFSQSLSLVKPTETSSFRNNALGGIINDDLDLIYDPIELNYVRNLHVYTNLSNLTSTHEQVFNSQSPGDNMFLLGISRENPFIANLTHALLFSFQKAQNPGSVRISSDLSGYYGDISGNGFLENIFNNYYDLGSDGIYDRKVYVNQNASSYDYSSGFKFMLNNSYSYQKFVFGVKLLVSNSKRENNRNSYPLGSYVYRLSSPYYDSPSFQREYLLTDLNLNTPLMHYFEKGDFDTFTETPLTFIDASASLTLIKTEEKSLEVRGDLLFSKYKNNTSTNDLYSGTYADYKPATPGYLLNYAENANYLNSTQEDGSWFGLSGEVRYVFIPQTQRLNEGFVNLKIQYIHSSFDNSSSINNSLTSADKEYNTSASDQLSSISSYGHNTTVGSGNDNNWIISAKTNMPLSDGVFFGIGFIFNHQSRTIESKYSDISSYVSQISSLDASQKATLKSTETIFSETMANQSIDNVNNQIVIPVGIEYKFTENQKWAMRFGSIFTYTKSTYNTAEQVTASIPQTTKLVVVGGNTTVTVDPNNYNSSSTQEIASSSQTIFTYGLGYTPTENLQIDVIGFFEVNNNVSLLEYVKSLRLSFVLIW